MNRPNILDIAARAGVSKSTAARVLSGRGSASERARGKVLAAASALRYRANPAARALRCGENRLLGIVAPARASRGTLSHAISAQKLEGLARGAKRLGYDLQIFFEDLNDPLALQRLATEKLVRGFFFLGRVQRPTLAFLKRYGIPWIGINWRHKENPADPHCWTDFAHAGRTLVGHLIECGCRRVLAFDWLSEDYGPFGQGVREAWSLCGRPARKLTLHQGAGFGYGAALDAALTEALDGPRARRPDGLLMSHEAGAVSAYRQLRARGLSVGREMAVATFDDLDSARHLDPPCTAYAQPTFEMGEAAVVELDRWLKAGRKGRLARAIPGTLRVRESTRDFRPGGVRA